MRPRTGLASPVDPWRLPARPSDIPIGAVIGIGVPRIPRWPASRGRSQRVGQEYAMGHAPAERDSVPKPWDVGMGDDASASVADQSTSHGPEQLRKAETNRRIVRL